MLGLNLATFAAMMVAAIDILGIGGWDLPRALMLLGFAVCLPWNVLGFWNGVIGLWLLRSGVNGRDAVSPYAAAGDVATPVTVRTAVLMTLRNEPPARALARLRIVKASLDETGFGGQFSYFILSDTNRADIAEAEEREVAAWQQQLGGLHGGRIVYRRRAVNTGFKAGNLHDFCAQWGDGFDLMLPLDADSLMSGETILRLVRIMQAHPKLGILQSLVVGTPTASAFARIFQFGMRHGMRSYTMGQAWWVGDCGPFWGHNAVLRIAPFAEHCKLPILSGRPPLGGHILSHDQVEAALMRRAGFEVRVLPEECGSWEDNPPTMLDYLARDTRWCQGNLQYLKLLGLPGLKLLSRYQLIWAIWMFLAIPGWTMMLALAPVLAMEMAGQPDCPSTGAALLYTVFLLMNQTAKLAGYADTCLTPGRVARYGGGLRFACGVVVEVVFSFLQHAIASFRTTLFMIFLLGGRSVSWSGQARDAYGVGLRTALLRLWPQTVFGVLVGGALWMVAPAAWWWAMPVLAGDILAIPFTCLTASPRVGLWSRSLGLCTIPDERHPTPEVLALMGESALGLAS